MYEPTSLPWIGVRSRVTDATWETRVAQAKRDEVVIKRILAAERKGLSLNAAIAKVLPSSRRSWALRRIAAYREHGFEALIDARTPREAQVSTACRQAVQSAREANPRLTVDEALEILRRLRITPLPSSATIKREFARVKERRKYARRKEAVQGRTRVIELPLAGGELLAAAEIETGGIAALTADVVELGKRAALASAGQTPSKDVERRSALGHFTGSYNRARRRRRGEEIASYLRSAEEKAKGRVPSWPRFVQEQPETIDAKLRMLVFCWMVSGSKGWDALRAPEVAGLESLTGFAYMPSTLAKFVSALSISGAAPRLIEATAKRWNEVAQERWQEGGAMAALYIDNHAKEVWSSLFTKSGKVSHLNRVMPCITTTYAHTGAGTPVVLSVQSGAAPLAPRLVELVDQAETALETDVERAVVIDSEGCTFDLLESFAKAERILITPLKPSRVPSLELRYTRGSYYRPYRDGDELRVARATLTHKTSGRSLEVGALLVRRAHRDSDTVLLTTGLALGMPCSCAPSPSRPRSWRPRSSRTGARINAPHRRWHRDAIGSMPSSRRARPAARRSRGWRSITSARSSWPRPPRSAPRKPVPYSTTSAVLATSWRRAPSRSPTAGDTSNLNAPFVNSTPRRTRSSPPPSSPRSSSSPSCCVSTCPTCP